MVRTTQTRKRSRPYGLYRAVKRRRFMRRRRYGRRTSTFTTQSGRGNAAVSLFRKRRFSARRYQRRLYRQTEFMPHYRSVRGFGVPHTTAGAINDAASNVFVEEPLQPLGADFWTAAGGAVSTDTTLPIFNNNSIVIRGGNVWLTIQNTDPDTVGSGFAGSSLRVKFWFGYTADRPVNIVAQFPSLQDNGWDPSLLGDFADNYGKIYYQTEVLLSPGQAFEFKRKLRASKIEYTTFKAQGNQPFFMYQVFPLDTGALGTFAVKAGYNLSFSGDANV